MNKLEFRESVRGFLRVSGHSMKDLAGVLGIQMPVLSRKLSEKGAGFLTYPEIKLIVKTLVDWKAVTAAHQVTELLSLLDLLPAFFNAREWETAPLNGLKRESEPPAPAAPLATPPATPPTYLREPAPVAVARFNNLPAQLTSLVGRERAIERGRDRVLDKNTRLVTFIGPGGSGKTRLALEIGRELVPEFRDGVCFVPLAGLSNAGQVVPTLLQTLGVAAAKEQSPLHSLLNFLHDKHLLLILDNFEHLLEAAGIIGEMLTGAASLKIIVTSRVVLQVYGEQEFGVPPLDLPEPHNLPSVSRLVKYEAIELFVERARAVKPDFILTDKNAQAVIQICTQLDGLPLALELAAAQIKLMPPAVLLELLKQQRLDLSNKNIANRSTRQKTLRDAIAWSYNLLDPVEQRLFARLGLFRGSFTLDAALAVCPPGSEIFEKVASLLNKSLLFPAQDRAEQPAFSAANHELEFTPGFSMLATLREYALEQLEKQGDREVVFRSLLDYYRRMAQTASLKLVGPDQLAWLALLDAEQDSFRAILESALKPPGQPAIAEAALTLAANLFNYWDIRGQFSEGFNYYSRLLAVGQAFGLDRSLPYALCKGRTGILAGRLGNFKAAEALLTESAREFHERGFALEEASSVNYLGIFALLSGNYPAARELHRRSFDLTSPAPNSLVRANTLNDLGVVETALKNYEAAYSYYLQCRQICEEQGYIRTLAVCLNNLGYTALLLKNYPEANSYYREAMPIILKLGDVRAQAIATHDMAFLAYMAGNISLALDYFLTSLTLANKIDHKLQTGESLALVGSLLVDLVSQESPAAGVPEATLHRAAELMGAGHALLGGDPSLAYLAVYTEKLALLKNRLGPTAFSVYYENGPRLGVDQILTYLDEFNRARAGAA